MSYKTKIDDDSKIMNESSENLCVVCFKNVEIYSIGECDHPVCYECSTRMRVLCEQNECPICRQSLSKVIFTDEKRPYRELETSNRSEYYNKKYKICFANLQIQKAFYDLLDHPCPKCDSKSFYSFDALKEHVRKEHELFYCDICVSHLKIFSFERKCYNRQELALHRRKGDPDNTSHRGHPLCQYCDLRYLDRDELFRHLRREHFFCHFCDADGSNQFYADYDSLCDHFRTVHYLCQEGDCASEQFTAAFRTEIDLKAHIANVHSKSLGKQQAKQARTLQLEITLGPRPGRSGGSGGSSSNHHQQDFSPIANLRSHRNNENNYNSNGRNETSRLPGGYNNHNPPKILDANNDQEFPSLGGASSATGVTLIHPNMSIRARAFGPSNIIRSKDEFPALGSTGGGGGSGGIGSGGGNNYDPGSNINQKSKYSNSLPVSAILKSKNNQQQHQATRPNSSGGSMVIHVSNRPNVNNNTNFSTSNNVTSASTKKFPSQKDFPALPGNFSSRSISPTPSNVNLASISAKHRPLINDYVSVANSTSNSKITLVQKETLMTGSSSSLSKKSATDSNNTNSAFVPSLTNNDFPALSGPNNHQPTTVSWVKSQKQQDYENRKSKVAPAPILNNGPQSTSKKQQQQQSDSNWKKDKKSSSSLINNSNTKNNEKRNKKSSENAASAAAGSKSLLSNKDKKLDNIKENKMANKNTNKKDKLLSSKINATENCSDKRGCESSGSGGNDSQLYQQIDSLIKNQQQSINFKNSAPPPPGFDKAIIDNNDSGNSYNSIGDNISNSSNNNSNSNSIKSAPPGFKSVTLNSVAKSPNNLTFTTSLGEIFSIVPNHQYIPPPNSTKRNQELVTHFQNTLCFPEAFEEFKHISQIYREGQYKALPYYEHCQAALKDKFDELFPELLVLLPDINKQQELYLVHCQYMKEATKTNNKKNQKKTQLKLEVCPTCKQVLKLADKQAHTKAHSLENNFPALNGVTGSNDGNNISHSIQKNKK